MVTGRPVGGAVDSELWVGIVLAFVTLVDGASVASTWWQIPGSLGRNLWNPLYQT
jgi:hypothetical protein